MTEEMEDNRDEILYILTENELSYIFSFCNLKMGDRIYHIEKSFFD